VIPIGSLCCFGVSRAIGSSFAGKTVTASGRNLWEPWLRVEESSKGTERRKSNARLGRVTDVGASNRVQHPSRQN